MESDCRCSPVMNIVRSV